VTICELEYFDALLHIADTDPSKGERKPKQDTHKSSKLITSIHHRMKQATTDKLNSPTTRKKNVQLRKTPLQ
jgi:hypothetical protein